MRRRQALAVLVGLGLASRPARADERERRRVANRLDLWRGFAGKTETLRARYTCTRRSSLLVDGALVSAGTLVFAAPATLVLCDDDERGAITRVDEGGLEILPVDPKLSGSTEKNAPATPAARWLSARLLALFAPGDGAAVTEGAIAQVPRARGMKLALLPPASSEVRRHLRRLLVGLEPRTGAVVELEIDETRGDRIRLEIHDHRQNVDPKLIEPIVARARR